MLKSIDIQLLIISTSFMKLSQLLILLHTWMSRKTYPGFVPWIFALVTSAAGMILILPFKNSPTPLFSTFVGSILIIGAQALVFWGVADYCGLSRLRLRNGINGAIVALSALLLGYFMLHDSPVARVVISGLSSGILFGRIALEPLFRATRRYSITPVLSVTMGGFGLLVIGRVLAVTLGLFPGEGALPPGEELLKVIMLAAMFVQVILVYSYIAMTDERIGRELQESETRFRILTATTTTGIFITRGARFDQVNPAISAITGYSAEELLSMEWPSLIHPEHRSLVFGESEARQRGEAAPQRRQIRIIAKGGEERWVDLTAGAITLEGAPATVTTLVDITEHKLAEALLTSAKQGADAANDAKSSFLATVSHEIRTPLHLLMGAVELLKESGLDHRQQRFASLIASSGENLQILIDDLLDISRIEAGRMELHPAPFALEGVATHLRELFRVQAEEQGVLLTCRLLAEAPPQVTGDRRRLLQILMNLVGNALKFTRSGEVELTIGPAPDALPSLIRFTVSDSGIGIAQEQRHRIFEPFSQVAAHQRGGLAGTGLGLAIVAGLTEAMGGRIDLAERPGGGSVFMVTVPLKAAIPTPAVRESDGTALLPPLRILAVDDIPENLELLQLYLEESPVTLTEASSGKEALHRLRNDSYDCVLLDIQMPEMNGYETVAALRAGELKQGGPRTPVIGISAGAFVTDINRALEAGCDTYLSRPFSRRKLLAAVAALVVLEPQPACDTAPQDLSHLLPKVRARLRLCAEILDEAVFRGDFSEVRRLGHAIKGLGMTYNLTTVERLGAAIEAEMEGDVAALERLTRQVAQAGEFPTVDITLP